MATFGLGCRVLNWAPSCKKRAHCPFGRIRGDKSRQKTEDAERSPEGIFSTWESELKISDSIKLIERMDDLATLPSTVEDRLHEMKWRSSWNGGSGDDDPNQPVSSPSPL